MRGLWAMKSKGVGLIVRAVSFQVGEGEAVGGRDGTVPFERTLVSFNRPSVVTFALSLRVSKILPLLCYSTSLFPTPPLVSPKFPLGVGR